MLAGPVVPRTIEARRQVACRGSRLRSPGPHLRFVTIIEVMSETMSLATVKAHFSEVADRVEKQQERIVVTRKGRPAVVLISPDDLESLEETLAILSDRRLMAKIRKGLTEAAADQGIPLERVIGSRPRN
jgi:antitoxin YefM